MLSPFSLKTLSVILLIACLVIGVNSSFAQENTSPIKCDGPFKGGQKPTQEQLQQILREHGKWLKGKKQEGARAKLCEANLTKAHLSMAHLIKADLTKADLTKAHLSMAYLIKADLTKANLTKAHLPMADLTKANLSKAELRGANLLKTNLAGATLTNVKNLTQAQLNQACVDEHTALPKGLSRPAPCAEVEELSQK